MLFCLPQFKLIIQICRPLNVLLLVKLLFYYYSNVSIAEMPEGWSSILKSNRNIFKKVTVYSGGVEVLNFVLHLHLSAAVNFKQ
jgi:hypothetical protein